MTDKTQTFTGREDRVGGTAMCSWKSSRLHNDDYDY